MRVILLTTGISLLLVCFAFVAYEFFTYRQNIKHELETVSRIVAANSTAALAFDHSEDATEILGALKTEPHVVAACLYDKSGKVFATYSANGSQQRFPPAPKVAGEGIYRFNGGFAEGFEPVKQEYELLGTLYVKSDLSAIYSRLSVFALIALALLGVAFLVAYFLSRNLQKSISGPILNLAATASVVSEKYDYSVRAARSEDNELGVLTDAFNHMLTQIELQNLEILLFNQKLEQKVIERTNELHSANLELQVKNDFVQTILDSSVDLVAVLDTEARFTTVNNQFCLVYRKTKDEVIGKKYEEAFPLAKDSQTHKDILTSLQGEYVHNQVVRSVLVDVYFENYFIPLKRDDKVYGVLVIGHDVSNIMAANEKLKRLNEQLVKSNQDLEQFAYVASHDLQEPLRKIQTFSQLAQKELSAASQPGKYLEKITASAKRMAELILAVLNYSRLSKNREQFEKVNLNLILTSIRTDLELLIAEKAAVINSDLLPVVDGIPLQLTQLFFNLIGNSLKFSDKPPLINLRSRYLKGAEIHEHQVQDQERDYAEIVITDNGVGFEQEYAERIFTIFQRLHDKQSYAGTGIGLALCKKIVENHNGFIHARSNLGDGAAFYIYIPVHHEDGPVE